MKIYTSLPQYRHQGLKTWMTRIAVNKAIDFKRAKARKREELTNEWEGHGVEPLPRESSVEDTVVCRERRARVRDYVDQLPESYRDVVVAFYIEEKSYQQIAEEQQIALKTVESKLYRAKQYMRKIWKEEEWE